MEEERQLREALELSRRQWGGQKNLDMALEERLAASGGSGGAREGTGGAGEGEVLGGGSVSVEDDLMAAVEASRREADRLEKEEIRCAVIASMTLPPHPSPPIPSSAAPPPLFDLSSLGLSPPPVVDEAIVAEIMAMGFGNANDIRFALKASKGLRDEAIARLLGQ